MIALDLIAEAERRGARFEVVGNQLRAAPKSAIPPQLYTAIGVYRAEVVGELLRRQERARVAPAIAETARKAMRELPSCLSHRGDPGATCLCCGAPWIEHYPA